jgi:hypothetical protein
VRNLHTLVISALVWFTPALGQVFEAGGYGGALRYGSRTLGTTGSTAPGDSVVPVQYNDSWMFGLRMTVNPWTHFGHEFGYSYHRSPLQFGSGSGVVAQGTAIHNGNYSFLAYAAPEGSRIRPFAAAGGKFSNFIVPGASVTSGGGETKVGFHYGGGVKIIVHRMFLIRLDARQYVSGKPFDLSGQKGLLRRAEISAGVSFFM